MNIWQQIEITMSVAYSVITQDDNNNGGGGHVMTK